MVKAVLFDIDGTLVDSNSFHVRAWREVFVEFGQDVAEDRIAGQIGKGGDLLVPTLCPALDKDTQGRLADRHGEVFKARYLDQVRPFPHARDLVARVHESGRKVVLASSASGEELDHYVGLLDLKPLIDATTSSEDVETSKPAPDIFGVACQKASVAPADAVVIGDSPFDLESARGAGTAMIAVLSGGFPREALAEADAIYADVADLLARYGESPLA